MDWLTILRSPVLHLIGAGCLGFFFKYLFDKFRTADRVATVEHRNFLLKEENAKLKSQISDLEAGKLEVEEDQTAYIAGLLERLAGYEDRDRVLAKYAFEQATGTWVRPDGSHYCPRCLKECSPPRESPMQPCTGGWLCPVCRLSQYRYSD